LSLEPTQTPETQYVQKDMFVQAMGGHQPLWRAVVHNIKARYFKRGQKWKELKKREKKEKIDLLEQSLLGRIGATSCL
jgi:hypothetical protein